MPPVTFFLQSKADTWKFVRTANKPSRARNLAFLSTSTAILNATAGQEFESQLPPDQKSIVPCPTYRTPYQQSLTGIHTKDIPEDRHPHTLSDGKPRKKRSPPLSFLSQASEVRAGPGSDSLFSTCCRRGRHNGPWEVKKWNNGTLEWWNTGIMG